MIKIDIVSDVACPWCYVGMKRLEKALALIPEVPVDIHWQPFQLDPNIPAEGRETRSYFISKFGSEEKVNQIFEHVEAVGKADGIDFKFKEMLKTMNSLSLHVLMHEAQKEGFKTELKKRFFKAYFEEVLDLSDRSILQSIMAEFKWSNEKTSSVMEDVNLQAEVKEKIKLYQSKGVNSVPFFVFNDTFGISGAQPVDVLVNSIKQMYQESQPAAANGEKCDLETGEC